MTGGLVDPNRRERVAVIGAGVSGLSAAYLLQRRYHVCIWVGVWLVSAQQWPGLVMFFSPLIMFYFLYFLSGKALLEPMMAKTKPGYADYVARTSGFLPRPPRRAG